MKVEGCWYRMRAAFFVAQTSQKTTNMSTRMSTTTKKRCSLCRRRGDDDGAGQGRWRWLKRAYGDGKLLPFTRPMRHAPTRRLFASETRCTRTTIISPSSPSPSSEMLKISQKIWPLPMRARSPKSGLADLDAQLKAAASRHGTQAHGLWVPHLVSVGVEVRFSRLFLVLIPSSPLIFPLSSTATTTAQTRQHGVGEPVIIDFELWRR